MGYKERQKVEKSWGKLGMKRITNKTRDLLFVRLFFFPPLLPSPFLSLLPIVFFPSIGSDFPTICMWSLRFYCFNLSRDLDTDCLFVTSTTTTKTTMVTKTTRKTTTATTNSQLAERVQQVFFLVVTSRVDFTSR